MAAPMRQLVSRRALSKYASLLQVRLMTGFQNRGNVPFFLDKCLQGQLVRNSSTMQSMRIPSQKVYRPDPSMSHDSFTVEMYKLKKNLQLRRYIPVAAFRRTCGLVNSRGTPISSIQGSELLSMTGEVLNVRNHRRKKLTMYVWNLLNSCEGYHLDLSNYTNYLMACKENKLSVDVTSLQEEMKQKGIQPDQEFYEELIGYHSAHGHYNSVRSLLENLKSDNFSLTANVFSNYIWAAFNAGFEGEMMTIFDSMSSHGITPDLNCYMTLMKCYAVKGDLPKITELIRQAEAVAGMRQVHQLQILLPLLQNGHRSEVNQVFDGLCVANTATKMDKMEIEYHGNQLNVNLFIQDGFNVYNLSDNTAVFFIRSYARGPGIDGRTINRPGTRKIDQTAAQRTVQMLNENKVSLQRMLLEARTISKEYITCVIWELKEQGVVESYDRFCSVLNSRPCSDYFNDESKEMLQRIAKDCFNSDTQPIGSSMPSIHTVQGHPQATYHSDEEILQEFNEMKYQRHSVSVSIEANKKRVMFMGQKKFDKAIYYQNEMIRAQPSFVPNFERVAYLAINMMENGAHEGIVRSLNDYLDIAAEMGSAMAEIHHKDLKSIMWVLSTFMDPAENLQILAQLRPHDKFLALESRAFLRNYMNRGAHEAVKALDELTKISLAGNQSLKIEFLKVMLQVVRDNEWNLIPTVYRIVERKEGKPSANLLQICAYLMNDQVEEARKLPKMTARHTTIRFAHMKACVRHLKFKPDMLNVFVELQDSQLLRHILHEMLQRGDEEAGSYTQGVKETITRYMNENPDSMLSVVCSDMMGNDKMELEKLRFRMMQKSKELKS